MFLALQELRAGDIPAAANAARRSLKLTVEYAPTFTAQTMDAVVAIVKRRSPAEAAVLLGALRAHRSRTHQAGTHNEIEGEARYEASLRRGLGEEFEAHYAQGVELDEPTMIDMAFTQLAAIAEPDAEEVRPQ
jgi:hypothetical protein